MTTDAEIKSSIELPRTLWDAAKLKALQEHTTVKEVVRRALARELGVNASGGSLPPESIEHKEDG